MTDQPAPERPDEKIEEEINDLLSEAQSLSEELQAEVGQDDVEPTARENQFFSSQTDSESSVDIQLAQADANLAEAREAISDDPPPKRPTKLTLPPKKGRELTASTPPDSSKPQPIRQIAVALPRKEGKPSKEAVLGTVRQEAADKPVAEDAAEEEAAPSSAAVSRLALWLQSCEQRVCTVLEVIDRPFSRIEYRTRVLLGWSSLILAVAAASIFFFIIL